MPTPSSQSRQQFAPENSQVPRLVKWGNACSQCAKAKAKCLRSNPLVGFKCDRWERLNKECTDKVHKVRKKRQRKPSRTAQLEERLNSVLELLQTSDSISPHARDTVSGLRQTSTANDHPRSTPPTPSADSDGTGTSGQDASPSFQPSLENVGPIYIPETYNSNGPPGCICRPIPGEVPGPMDSDEILLRLYRTELTPNHPFVVIPHHMTSAELLATRPFLMCCIRMVASFRSLRSMQGQMYQIMSQIAQKMLLQSERSLDLLSGIVVILGWYHYHCFVHSQMHNLVSLAMSLVAELGLKRKPSWQERTRLLVVNLGEVKERTIEEKRLYLAVWYISSCVSLSFQQLDALTYSSYMDQCLAELEIAGEYESDTHLVTLVRTQKLSEKIAQVRMVDDTNAEQGYIPKAPVSGYISAFQLELDKIRTNMPENLQQNSLIKIRLNTTFLRLYEPPALSASLLIGISESLTNLPSIPGSPSPLDDLYRSNAALKAWYDGCFSFPVQSYYSIPLPLALDMVYAVTMLGRWAKLAAPGTVRPTFVTLPDDPSGSYNNPDSRKIATGGSSQNSSLSPVQDTQLLNAIKTLKGELSTHPGLSLNVTEVLGTFADKFHEASALLAAEDVEPQAWKQSIWAQSATKLKIAQLRLEQWAKMLAKDNQSGEKTFAYTAQPQQWSNGWTMSNVPLNDDFYGGSEEIVPMESTLDWSLSWLGQPDSIFEF